MYILIVISVTVPEQLVSELFHEVVTMLLEITSFWPTYSFHVSPKTSNNNTFGKQANPLHSNNMCVEIYSGS